ncbi:MAG: hypothetical protein JWN44_5993 [Myxococcales bacterium]|nr:hypothetical protein [Myxococcales bacterium]
MALVLEPLEQLPPGVERAVGAKAPAPLKMMAARGLAPMPPGELVTALYQLTFVEDEAIKSAAYKTATELPEKMLGGALEGALDARVLDFFARRVFAKPALLEKVLLNRATADETFAHLAGLVDENALEMIAKNEERLLRHPQIIAALYMNPKTRMSTAQRALELAVRNQVRVDGIPAFDEASRTIRQSGGIDPVEAANDDEAFARAAEVAVDQTAALQLVAVDEEEAARQAELDAAEAEKAVEAPGVVEEEKKKKISDLSPAAKIRLATLGNAFARAVLIRDTNRLVSMAAIRSPGVSPMEVIRYATNRALDDDIIRYIAGQRQWVRLSSVKIALCNNPKCPLPVAMRFLPHLNARDLKLLARSKGIPSALSTAAKQLLQQRNQ